MVQAPGTDRLGVRAFESFRGSSGVEIAPASTILNRERTTRGSGPSILELDGELATVPADS